jgi:hypothetical protein
MKSRKNFMTISGIRAAVFSIKYYLI